MFSLVILRFVELDLSCLQSRTLLSGPRSSESANDPYSIIDKEVISLHESVCGSVPPVKSSSGGQSLKL